MQADYREKVYSGFLGMNIGIRLGAPVEPTIWTYERIRDTYGEIKGYVKDYINFAADDDANGPFYFLRALYDKPAGRPLEPGDVANAWLNYAREGVGMFWWGGYGRSTEHTAYLNLKHGVPAPHSGSIEQNGKIIAEQIGGQIFIDTWGLVNPGNPGRAADFGQIAASVSHDGEGLFGARFFCAAIAEAFTTSDIRKIIETGLAQIPSDSLYTKVARAVEAYYEKNSQDWRGCRAMLEAEWGYDKYRGVCHIIPNAGVCFLAMLYGGGDFARTVEIATMCGWDTDCNAGNVGTVLGVAAGIDGIPSRYREPVKDFIALSGISGFLNNLEVPGYARELSLLGYELNGEIPPEDLKKEFHPGEMHFDFDLPGSTHGIRLSDTFFCKMEHTFEKAASGKGSLKILVDRMSRGDQCKIFYKPFYTRADFSDERYMPVFSPKVYSGQTLSCEIFLEQWEGWEAPAFIPYARTAWDKKEFRGGDVQLKPKGWQSVTWIIPDTEGGLIDEVGFILEGYSIAKAKTLGHIYLDDFRVRGIANYRLVMKKQRGEFGTITPFAVDHGAWSLEGGKLFLMRCEPSFAYAGNYYSRDLALTVPVTPVSGESHMLLIRAKGTLWGYAAGLSANGTVSIYKNDHGYKVLKSAAFDWKAGTTYVFSFKALGKKLSLDIDGRHVLEIEDPSFEGGMYGCGSLSMGRTEFGDFIIEEL